MEPAAQQTKGPDQKYCMDCGKLLLLRAEICPGCGCRQAVIEPIQPLTHQQFKVDSLAGPMILLLILNALWNGLGNIAIGDKRGWGWGFANCLIFALAIFTAGVPAMIFFAYCGFEGYKFLAAKSSREAESTLAAQAGQRTV